MAEKIATTESGGENTPVKRKHRCCTCCLAAIIVLLVILAAAFGVGWYFGDKYTKENLNMSLGDTLGVMSDLYWTKDKDVVTNPYNKSDVELFYKEIKRNIFLKDDADVDFDGALAAALEKYMTAPSAQAAPARNSDGSENVEEGNDENRSQLLDVFTGMISGVLSRENLDLERLERYNENDPSTDEYIFDLNDKQLAAFISSILDTALKNATGIESLAEISKMVDLRSVVALKQIRFAEQKNGDETVSTTADVTVWIGLQDAVGQALTYYLKQGGLGWLGWLARGMGNMLLPENLYATVTLPLYGDAEPLINLNNMNSAERERAYKLVDGVLNMSDSDKTLKSILVEYADVIKPYLESASEKMPLDKVENGTITIDLLDTVARMASGDDVGVPLTKADFIYVLKAVMSDAAEQYRIIEPYRYKDVYLLDGNEKFVAGGVEGQTAIDYEQKFVEAIADAYSLDLDGSSELTDVLALMGVSLDGSSSSVDADGILDRVNSEKFNAALNADEAVKLYVTDKMLAAAFSEKLKSKLVGGMDGLDMDLLALTFVTKQNSPAHEFVMVTVQVNLAAMLGDLGGGLMTELAAGLMPESILLTVYADITQDGKLAAGDKREPVEYKLNSCNDTQRALAAIEKIAPSVNLNNMSEQIESMMNDMLDQMFSKLKGMELRTSMLEYDDNSDAWRGDHGAVVMPDIFTIIADLAITDKTTGEAVIDSQGLRNVLKALNNAESFPKTQQIELDEITGKPDYSGFIDDVVDKYYLDKKDETLDTFDALTAFMSSGADGFDTGKLRVTGSDTSVKYLAYDTRVTTRALDTSENKNNNLQPVMTPSQLGAFLQTEMAGNESVENYNIMSVYTDTDMLELVLAIDVKSLLPEKVSKLLATEKIYVTATIDMSETESDESDGKRYYPVTTRINEMGDDPDTDKTYGDTLTVVRCFMPDFDIEKQVLELGKTMYEQMDKLNESIAGDNGTMQFFTFRKEGLIMTDFYTFLSNKMDLVLTEERTSETVKQAVQGMYVRSDIEAFINSNNYVLSDARYAADMLLRNPAPEGQTAMTTAEAAEFAVKPSVSSDITFNRFMKQVERIDAKKEVSAIQTVILAKSNITDAAESARAWLNARVAHGKTVNTANDYIVMTFKLTMGNMLDGENEMNANLTPNEVYATVVYMYNGDGAFEQVDVIFNGMTAAEFDIINELMTQKDTSGDTTSKDKVNITTIANEGATILNRLAQSGDVAFGGRIEEGDGENKVAVGIGSIAYTPKSAI